MNPSPQALVHTLHSTPPNVRLPPALPLHLVHWLTDTPMGSNQRDIPRSLLWFQRLSDLFCFPVVKSPNHQLPNTHTHTHTHTFFSLFFFFFFLPTRLQTSGFLLVLPLISPASPNNYTTHLKSPHPQRVKSSELLSLFAWQELLIQLTHAALGSLSPFPSQTVLGYFKFSWNYIHSSK